jgi:hypothetical protein
MRPAAAAPDLRGKAAARVERLVALAGLHLGM